MFIVQLPTKEQENIRARIEKALRYELGDEPSDSEIASMVEDAMCDKMQNIVPLLEEVESYYDLSN